ncbi:hypothetical protein GQX73_g6054 [Xylaria multiplex]|uniref:Kelch repeat protein n=1 Tax=Xylaria multiplex TaxID=323545 RepID=A0A7C8MPW8_9PEZI|nr:hypothetical protein GQX73_g6054 [Xylaria multiplex]
MKGQCYPFVLLAVWGALGKLGLARDLELVGRDDSNGGDIPSVDDFVRRGCHTVAVLGDYLYIDGGQITERVNDSTPADITTTWSIDLTESWTNETVKLRSIPKEAPLLAKQIHWTDSTRKSLYTWGGFTSNGSSPNQALWRFTADASGGGTWTQVTQRDYLNFSKLKGTFGSAFTQSKDVGYSIGGAVMKSSDSSVAKELPGYATPGIVSYDFRTGSWDNTTITVASRGGYGGYGTSLNARAEHVPFGPNGLLLLLGGAETQVDATNDSIVEVNWNTISMVDPVTKKWYRQTTSGTKPPTIESHCSVGKQGPNGTYEIFLYGGVSDQIRDTSSEVYVLSLPGFVFFKGPKDGPPRSDHQCAIVGEGQRQMISVGGVDGENRTFTAPTTADPWAYGIGILDMTELEWTDSYDADAPDYESPTAVKDWYDAGNLQNVPWDSEEVETIFMREPAPTATATDAPIASGVGSQSTGAIVGGAVGGVVGVAALGMMSFFLVRRRRRVRADTPESRRRLAPAATNMEQIAEYKPEPWPKDHHGGPGYYSPDSLLSGPTIQSLSKSPQPHYNPTYYTQTPDVQTHEVWRSELSGHQDGIVTVRGGELPGTEPRVGELMDPSIQWAHELPAPLESPRTELPDRKYSQ